MEFNYEDEFIDRAVDCYDDDMTAEECFEVMDPALKFAADHFEEMVQEQHQEGRMYIWNSIKMNAIQNFIEDLVVCLREKDISFKYSVKNGNPLVGTIDVVFIVEEIILSFEKLKNVIFSHANSRMELISHL